MGTEYFFILILLALGRSARIALHHWDCPARAQRCGVTAWTITVACGFTLDCIVYHLDPKALCQGAGDLYLFPVGSILIMLVNASHGMEFWHTASLGGLVLCGLTFRLTTCADSAPFILAIAALVVTFGAGHFAQLLARHAFLRFEHIQTSRDRLEYDFQRLEYRIFGSSGPRLPPAVTPTESSATTISAAPQREASSVPEATGGGHTALPAGQVLIEWPPPHATHPSTAGPSTAGPSTAGPSTAADPLSASVALTASAGPSTAGPSTAGPSTAGPSTAGPSTAGPSTAGPSNAADPLSASDPLAAPAPPPPLPPLSASVSVTALEFQALLNAQRLEPWPCVTVAPTL